MHSTAPLPADVVALRALRKAARQYAAAELLGEYVETSSKLQEAALAYAQAVKDTKRARRTGR